MNDAPPDLLDGHDHHRNHATGHAARPGRRFSLEDRHAAARRLRGPGLDGVEPAAHDIARFPVRLTSARLAAASTQAMPRARQPPATAMPRSRGHA